MISSNSFSSSSTTSSLSSGIDGKDSQIFFGESKSFQAQNSLEGEKDQRYWERRRKNNAAAKRSRERRRQHDVAMEKQIQNLKLANSLLKNQIIILQQKLSLQTSPIESSNISPGIAQHQNYFHVEEISGLFTGNIATCTGVNNSTESMVFPHSLTNMSPTCINSFSTQVVSEQQNPVQNPLDLSLKVKTESIPVSNIYNSTSKHHSRSNSENCNLDQRYWDRRRRNNEAVRKCRQNKKVKMQCNNNNNNNPNDNNNNVDKVQIKTKIESITNELEKLKSQLQNSEIISTGKPDKCPIKMEEFVPNLSQRIHLNENCKKTIKWKNKLIEANQAEKEIANQIRV